MGNADYGQGAEVLSKAAGMVQTAKVDLDRTGSNLEQNLGATKSTWVGQGGMAFTKLYTDWVAKQKQIVKTLDEFEMSLRSTEKDNVNTDQSQSSNLGAISNRLNG